MTEKKVNRRIVVGLSSGVFFSLIFILLASGIFGLHGCLFASLIAALIMDRLCIFLGWYK